MGPERGGKFVLEIMAMEEHLYNRRKRNHDYYKPFIYHIILKKRKGAPDFSRIVGNPEIPRGETGFPRCEYSTLGMSIFYAWKDFGAQYREIRNMQYAIMPDHVHLVLQKLTYTDIHMETYMNILKCMVVERYRKRTGKNLTPDEIFEYRFTDKLLFRKVNLRDWIDYVALNPYRRAVIMKNPDFFKRINNLKIGEKIYKAYGNPFLFDNPDKFAVRVRRNFTPEETNLHKEEALYTAETGGILVSPFISGTEKNIRAEAEEMKGKFILLQHEELEDRFKPSRREFNLCHEGRMLIISLGMPKGTKLDYEISTEMNELAALICKG